MAILPRFIPKLSLFLLFALYLSSICSCSLPKTPTKRSYDTHQYYAIELPAHLASYTHALEKAVSLGLELVESIGELGDTHWLARCTHSESKRKRRSWGKSNPAGVSVLTPKLRAKRVQIHERAIIPVPESWEVVAKDLSINDPDFKNQWHLVNTKIPQNTINVTGLWEEGITGKGVKVCVVDDGLDMHSDDLAANFFPEGSYDFNDHTNLPEPRLSDDNHGTRCAGEIAAVRNDVCGVGVAYDAQIAGVRMLSASVTDADEAASLNFAYQLNDIYSCSWGPSDDGRTMEGPQRLIKQAFINGVTRGRAGKGSIFVFASGNGAGSGDHCNADGYTNSIYSITVSSIGRNQGHPMYSEGCSANMVVTYSSGDGDHIHTTDVGKNRCTAVHGGTSAAAPMAAGIFALVLQVRPELTWRDLQYLCIQSAAPVQPDHESWEDTATDGRRYSNMFGYGNLDAYAIVQAAKNWKLVKPQAWLESGELPEVPDAGTPIPQGLTGYTTTWTATEEMLKNSNLERLEHLTVTLWVNHQRRGEIEAEIVSPSGIKSVLYAARRSDSADTGMTAWQVMSIKSWGENPVGTWKLTVFDKQENEHNGSFLGWKMTLWGVSRNAALATPYRLPPPTKEELEDGNGEEDEVDTSTASSTSSYIIPKPTKFLPTDHAGASEDVPTPSSQPQDEGDKLSSGSKSTWIYSAIAIFVVLLATGGGIWFFLHNRRRSRGGTGYREVFSADYDDGQSILGRAKSIFRNSAGGSGRGGRGQRSKILYDAFEGISDDDNDSDDNIDHHERGSRGEASANTGSERMPLVKEQGRESLDLESTISREVTPSRESRPS